jgi:hypothetical protein
MNEIAERLASGPVEWVEQRPPYSLQEARDRLADLLVTMPPKPLWAAYLPPNPSTHFDQRMHLTLEDMRGISPCRVDENGKKILVPLVMNRG